MLFCDAGFVFSGEIQRVGRAIQRGRHAAVCSDKSHFFFSCHCLNTEERREEKCFVKNIFPKFKAHIPCVSLRATTHALIDHRLPASPEIITENVSRSNCPPLTHKKKRTHMKEISHKGEMAFNRSAARCHAIRFIFSKSPARVKAGAGTDVVCE